MAQLRLTYAQLTKTRRIDVTPTKPKTQGISPKVYIPAAAQIVGGIALLIAGLDVEGRTAIVTGVGTLLVGFGADPGKVT